MTKIAGISDIHGMMFDRDEETGDFSTEIDYPEADVLCIAGDVLRNYSPMRQEDAVLQLGELHFLNKFLGTLKEKGTYKEIIFVAGNHDFAFQLQSQAARQILTNAIYLEDSGVAIDGVKFYGSPWQPWFYDWAFNFPQGFKAGREAAETCWGKIPDDTNVLITHGPPYEILDLTAGLQRVGCPYLHRRVMELCEKELKLHIFGHIHYDYGIKTIGGFGPKAKIFMNAAACDESYDPTNPVQVVEI